MYLIQLVVSVRIIHSNKIISKFHQLLNQQEFIYVLEIVKQFSIYSVWCYEEVVSAFQ